MPNGNPDFDVLVGDFFQAYEGQAGPITPPERATMTASLRNIYQARFNFRMSTLDWPLMRVQAATLGYVAAVMLQEERTSTKFWGTEGNPQSGAPAGPQQIEWAREVFGTPAQPTVPAEVFERLKERAEEMDLPIDQADEACELCTNNP